MRGLVYALAIILLVIGAFAVPAGIITTIYYGAEGATLFVALWQGAKVWMFSLASALVGALLFGIAEAF